MSAGKGDKRRPAAVPAREVEEAWARTFGARAEAEAESVEEPKSVQSSTC